MNLSCGERSVDVAGIVDSGADGTLFPLALAPYLGLDHASLRSQGDSTGADGTSFQTWTTTEPIRGRVFAVMPAGPAQMFGPVFELEPAFARGDIILWGRRDFFAHFTVTFEPHARLGPLLHLDC